jgi:hypothetical protein
MDKLTERGLKYIRENFSLLVDFATQKIDLMDSPEGVKLYGDTGWFGFDITTGTDETKDSKLENVIDVSVWLDEDERSSVNVWRGTAYPMHWTNGLIETNTGDFISLF